jgi:hypothetical protein
LIDNRRDPRCQLSHREGLGQDVHSWYQAAIPDGRIFRIAGDEQHFQIRSALLRSLGHLAAVHPARQTDICDQQIVCEFFNMGNSGIAPQRCTGNQLSKATRLA